MRPEDQGLLPENIPRLNERFYEMRPWEHLRYRVLHLAAAAGHPDQFTALQQDGVTIGDVTLTMTPTDEDGDVTQNGHLAFVAAETEMLVQHSCETLLRLWFAHRPDAHGRAPDCPWLVLARDRSFVKFKERCAALRSVSDQDLELSVAQVFINTGTAFSAEDLASARATAKCLKLAARLCLQSNAYNSAKHGLAVRGGRSRFALDVEDLRVFDVDGFEIEMLEVATDPQSRQRWSITTKWVSLERCLVVAWIVANLVQSMWSVGQYRYVTREGMVRVFMANDIEKFLEYGEIVLVEQRQWLLYDNGPS